MENLKKRLSIFFVVFILLTVGYLPVGGENKGILYLKDITCENLVQRIRVTFHFSEPVRYLVKKFMKPVRIIIGVYDRDLYVYRKQSYVFNKDIVKSVRLNYADKRKEPPYLIEYMVLELDRFTPEKIYTKKNMVIVDVSVPRDIEKGAIPFFLDRLVGRGDAIPEDLTSFIEYFKEQYRKKRSKDFRAQDKANLSECIKVALFNSLKCKIAEEDIELADMRQNNAYRNLYPFISGEVENIEGEQTEELNLPEFQERSFGLRGEQTVTASGGFRYIFEKARLEKELAQQRYRKEHQDLVSQVGEAYIDLSGEIFKRDNGEELWKRVESVFDKVEKKYRLGLINKAEYLENSYIYNQFILKNHLIKKELNLARLNLFEVLNLEPFLLEVNTTFKDKFEDITFEKCYSLSIENNVDLSISEIEKDIANYAMKIMQSERKLKTGIEGFYGRSGAAFKPDDLDFTEDWEARTNLFRDMLLGNFTTQVSALKTQPKLGESTRREEQRAIARLGIVDNLESIVKDRESQVRYRKALWDFMQKKKELHRDIKRAYFDYADAVKRMKLSEIEREFREEDLRITERKNRMNMVPDRMVMQALLSLAEAETAYTEAFIFSEKALVKLNKLMGVENFKIQ